MRKFWFVFLFMVIPVLFLAGYLAGVCFAKADDAKLMPKPMPQPTQTLYIPGKVEGMDADVWISWTPIGVLVVRRGYGVPGGYQAEWVVPQ
jgi:hypothetical protein